MREVRLNRRHLAAGNIDPSGICIVDSLYQKPCSAEHLRCLALNCDSLKSRHASINFALSDPSSLVRLDAAKRLAIHWKTIFEKGFFDQVISDIKDKSSNPFIYFKGTDPRLSKHMRSDTEIAGRNYRLSVLMAVQNIFSDSDSAFSKKLALAIRANNFLESLNDQPSFSKIAISLQTDNNFFPEINRNSDNPFENIFSIIKTAIVSNMLSNKDLRTKFFGEISNLPDLSKYEARNNAVIFTTRIIIDCLRQLFEHDQSFTNALNSYCDKGYPRY